MGGFRRLADHQRLPGPGPTPIAQALAFIGRIAAGLEVREAAVPQPRITQRPHRPAALERLFNRWRAASLAGEHIVGVELDRDAAYAEHLVLEVEYEPDNAAWLAGPTSGPAVEAGGNALLREIEALIACFSPYSQER